MRRCRPMCPPSRERLNSAASRDRPQRRAGRPGLFSRPAGLYNEHSVSIITQWRARRSRDAEREIELTRHPLWRSQSIVAQSAQRRVVAVCCRRVLAVPPLEFAGVGRRRVSSCVVVVVECWGVLAVVYSVHTSASVHKIAKKRKDSALTTARPCSINAPVNALSVADVPDGVRLRSRRDASVLRRPFHPSVAVGLGVLQSSAGA